MNLVSELDLPVFDYSAPDFSADRYHQQLAETRQRGWLAVLSLRLIPMVPFAVVNYAAGASAVRPLPYSLATLVGLVPGTVAVVVLGDAFTGNVSPLLALVSVCTAAVGLGGLLYEVRKHRREA